MSLATLLRIPQPARTPHSSRKNGDQTALDLWPVFGKFCRRTGRCWETIRASHERWDGSGYPDGLQGKNIPEAAPYLAVAIYYIECKLPKEQALEQILRMSGKAFDPEAVRLFMKATRLDLFASEGKRSAF